MVQNHNLTPSWAGKLCQSADPVTRGLDYLYGVRYLTLEPGMVDAQAHSPDRTQLYAWIGNHVEEVNALLNVYLNVCHECFHPWQRREMRILATPLAQSYGIDGLCNIQIQPITILIDVGRVTPADWLGLVVHEYTHAHLSYPGHNQEFASVLSHLCLGLGLEPPRQAIESVLRHWPHCQPTADPLAFWMGVGAWGSGGVSG